MSAAPTVKPELEKVQVEEPTPADEDATGTVHSGPEASEKVTVPVGVSWFPRPMPPAVTVAVKAIGCPAP